MPTPSKQRTTRTKSIKRAVQEPNVIVLDTKWVSVHELQPYYKNPRIGDVELVAKSLHLNGQYKPIVVNIGSKTGRPNEILAGNHTWIAARREVTWEEVLPDKSVVEYHKGAWETILATFVDVDDNTAAAIVIADNKTAEHSTYDDALLAEIMRQSQSALVPISALGMDSIEFEDILANAPQLSDQETRDLLSGVLDDLSMGTEDNRTNREKYQEELTEEQKEANRARGVVVGEESEDDLEIDKVPPSREQQVAELQIVLEMKMGNVWKGPNEWGIPELLEDRLLDRFPEGIGTWGGHDVTPDDGKKWFLYNYSLGGMKGLPLDRTILSFYTYDEKFYNWWETPAFMVSRFLDRGLTTAVVPDFSFYYDETRAHHMWSVYRAQWLGRFFQEAGLTVVPRFQFDFMDPNTLDIALLGIPIEPPTLAVSLQNFKQEGEAEKGTKVLREALNIIKPKQLLVYGGPPGWKSFLETGWKGEAIHCLNYAGVRRGVAYDKKEAKAKLTKKQRDEIVTKHGGDPKAPKGRRRVVDEESL